MFEVRNRNSILVYQSGEFSRAKEYAKELAKEFDEPFDIFEIKQVWTTETSDEVLKD